MHQDKLMQYALRIISKKRYTLHEMSMKLERYIKKQEEPDMYEVKPVLDRLLELDYLNDNNFARDYISDRIRFKPRGRMLIENELLKKGVNKNTINLVFDSIDFDETKIAEELISRRKSNWGGLPYEKQREKASRFLYSRGFNSESIYKTINSCYSR